MSAIGKTGNLAAPSRRGFLKVSLAAGGGMLLGFPAGCRAGQAPAKYVLAARSLYPHRSGRPCGPDHSAGGDGAGCLHLAVATAGRRTGCGHRPGDPGSRPAQRHDLWPPTGGGQGTGGSTSIRAFYTALRQVGASARAMLVSGRGGSNGMSIPPACAPIMAR